MIFSQPGRIDAVVLAADAAWCEASVSSFYELVQTVWISFDADDLGWTGHPVNARKTVERIRAMDRFQKVRLLPGTFHGGTRLPMEWETYQRQIALDAAFADGATWVLNLDTDEIMPDMSAIRRAVSTISPRYKAVSWPLRSFFNALENQRFLEVCGLAGWTVTEEVPIVFRKGVRLARARRTLDPTLRIGTRMECLKDAIRRPMGRLVHHAYVSDESALLHLSWVRTEEDIRQKVRSWGHAIDFDTEAFVRDVWRGSRETWKNLRNFHPLHPKLWPRLRQTRLGLTHDMEGVRVNSDA